MIGGKYILNARGEPVPEPNLLKWAHWFDRANRTVHRDMVGPLRVSTVFLGLDHSFGAGPPVLWETMVFDPEGDYHYQSRCTGGREQAEAMHARVLADVRNDHPEFVTADSRGATSRRRTFARSSAPRAAPPLPRAPRPASRATRRNKPGK